MSCKYYGLREEEETENTGWGQKGTAQPRKHLVIRNKQKIYSNF